MLLVDNDQTQVAERQHHGRACSQNQLVWVLTSLFVPDLHAYVIGAAGVVYAHVIAENTL